MAERVIVVALPVAPTRSDDAARTWVHCVNCGRKLGQIVNGRFVVKVDRQMTSHRIDADPKTVCPHCGEVNGIAI